MSGGAGIGLFWEPGGFLKQFGGGIVLLIIFLIVFAGPRVYNSRASRFEKGRAVLDTLDDLGVVQGLRGAFFRLLLYDDGLEIRAFYHRYFIPFAEIDGIALEKGLLHTRLHIATGIAGVPRCVTATDTKLVDLARRIEDGIRSQKALAARGGEPPG